MTKVWQRHIEEIPTQKTAFRGKDMWQDFWRRPLVTITYDMYFRPDQLDRYYKGILVATTHGLGSGTGTLTWHYHPAPGDPL